MDGQASSINSRVRPVSLCCLALAELLWTVLLCIALFCQWEVLYGSEKSLLFVMLVTHTLGAIMLPVLLILPFRPWLDAARIMLLLVIHLGTAIAWAYWYPRFECSTQNPEQDGVCRVIIAYILIASWFLPVLLLVYEIGLAFMIWRYPTLAEEKSISVVDEEASISRTPASHSDTKPETTPMTLAGADRTSNLRHFSNISGNGRHSYSNKTTSVDEESKIAPAIAARLSKPIPAFHF